MLRVEVGDEYAFYFELLYNMEMKFYYNKLALHVLCFIKTTWTKKNGFLPFSRQVGKVNHIGIGCINSFLA